jgi:hypothetical protein
MRTGSLENFKGLSREWSLGLSVSNKCMPLALLIPVALAVVMEM